MKWAVAILLTLAALAAPTPARAQAAPTAAEIVDSVKAFYAAVPSMKAKVRHEVTHPAARKTVVDDGELLIKQPGKMRWSYYSKRGSGRVKMASWVVANGSSIALVHATAPNVGVPLTTSLLPIAIVFATGTVDLAADFTARLDTSGTYGGEADRVIELVPKQASTLYQTLHLVVHATHFRVRESIIHDHRGGVHHVRFYEPHFAAKIDEALFIVPP